MGGSSAQDFGYKVALDPAGMIYLSGYTQGAFDGQTNMGGDVEPPMIEAPKIVPPRAVSPAELESANPA